MILFSGTEPLYTWREDELCRTLDEELCGFTLDDEPGGVTLEEDCPGCTADDVPCELDDSTVSLDAGFIAEEDSTLTLDNGFAPLDEGLFVAEDKSCSAEELSIPATGSGPEEESSPQAKKASVKGNSDKQATCAKFFFISFSFLN